ncbi:electron transfer flavoprotein subunit beta [Clostridia bacterium]|nr:electron transfer flavoprotein subunit beta [Clostridia bacterium]
MEIFVCIKQVPATSNVRVDDSTGVLIRQGVESKMNPYDLFALEAALRLKESDGARVTVGTMGPPQAADIIREAYWMGADAGYLLSDRRMGGADVLATSYTLAQAVRSIGDFDLILCGRQTTDGDTAQVGPAMAEHLKIPHAAWASSLTVDGGSVRVEQQLQDVVETVWMPFPCLVTVEQDIYTPRLPSLKRRKVVKDWPVATITLDNLPDTNAEHYGLSGSPTQVEKIFPPERESARELWAGSDSASRLMDWLRREKFIQVNQLTARKGA